MAMAFMTPLYSMPSFRCLSLAPTDSISPFSKFKFPRQCIWLPQFILMCQSFLASQCYSHYVHLYNLAKSLVLPNYVLLFYLHHFILIHHFLLDVFTIWMVSHFDKIWHHIYLLLHSLNYTDPIVNLEQIKIKESVYKHNSFSLKHYEKKKKN